jgi:uncharacterized protein (UPF0276 family)
MGFRDRHSVPDLGVGVGFRPKHAMAVLAGPPPPIDWFEVTSENFMVDGGRPLANLERLRARWPVVPHGVSLGLGSAGSLDVGYLKRLRELVDRLDPPWVSDHLCWTRAGGHDLHDLLPLPHTRAVVEHVADRIKRVQDVLRRPFAVENVSSYMTFRESTMTEWELLGEVAERADCGILFDVNNVYVSARNHGFDAATYVDAVARDRVLQIHLAGHTDAGTHLLDTHSDHVCEAVWSLYDRTIRRVGAVSTLIEWDEAIPEWPVLEAEATRAKAARASALEGSR